MPIEHDEESTSFDPRPWGAQQRNLPRSNFTRVIPPLPIPVAARAITPLGVPFVRPPVHSFVPAPIQPPYMPAISFAPLEMPAFNAPIDSTVRVHRQPLTLRSFVAVPLGALVAILVIAVGYRASTFNPTGSVAASSIQIAQHVEAPVLAPPVPAVAPMTPDPIEGVATFDAPVTSERTIPAEAKAPAPRKHVSRKHRPRKIVAVDSSTPLGNLRPRRY